VLIALAVISKKKVVGVVGAQIQGVIANGVALLIIGGLGVCGVAVVVVNSIDRELVNSMARAWAALLSIKIVLVVGDFLTRLFRIVCLGVYLEGEGERKAAVLSPD
jgi:hypothetical protein